MIMNADDLIIMGETREEVEEQLHNLKGALARGGFMINTGKNKILVSGKEGLAPLPSGQCPS